MSAAIFDAVVIGAGAAGLFCAAQAGQRGLKVLLIDHSARVAEKVRISGGGRCNFTNRWLDPRAPQQHFVGANPAFARSALARFTPQDFIALVERHGIAYHEKHKGQLFCDRSAEDIIAMLLAECEAGAVTRWQPCAVKNLSFLPEPQRESVRLRYQLESDRGAVLTHSVVVATGGLSVPKIGASDFGWRVAAEFGLRTVPPRPGLVPLSFDAQAWAPWAELAGLSLVVDISTGEGRAQTHFREDLLFTHHGLSGPAVLQISNYWQPCTPIRINLAPGIDLAQRLIDAKARSRKQVANELAAFLPARLANTWVARDAAWQRPIAEASDRALRQLGEALQRWELTPTGTEGWRKAEVTLGGVDTRDLSQQTLQSRQSGLYFIGEAVDIAGWLGGYNFQWAWASAHACASALEPL